MGIKLVKKRANIFHVEVMYSQIGDFNSDSDNEDGLVLDNTYDSSYFIERVLPYIEQMLTFTGGVALDKEKKKGKTPVMEMNIGENYHQDVWDKLVEVGLIEYGVEHLEAVNIEHVDGNGVAYNVEVSGRKTKEKENKETVE